MTDNFERFRPFMQLPKEEGGDAYYVIELVRRGKDCPDLPAANYDRPALRACLFRGGVKTQTDTCRYS